MKANVGAVIVAAGEGTRLGATLRKAYVPLRGRPLFLWSLEVFLSQLGPETVVLVVHPEERARTEELLKAEGIRGVHLADGGRRRQDSVRLGVLALPPGIDYVLVHDAARPFVTPALIERVTDALAPDRAVVPALPVKETIKRVSGTDAGRGRVVETPPREALYAAQTPQGFPRAALVLALEKAERSGVEVTDEATLFEGEGRETIVVPGDEANIKITTASDLWVAEAFAAGGERRRV
ncbi:MAG: 2-C-methyl-D-erythritol 4-phosphate cytidylyltransferase [Hydrogenibacillus sp.]|nr:2-C-methyl-D-erythritol 4-phosphate cytidylyltransferase [Hydrogenibacillus sp.]